MIGLYKAIPYYMSIYIGPYLLVGLYKAIRYNDYTGLYHIMRLCKAIPYYRLYTATLYYRAIQGYTLVHNYIAPYLIMGLYKTTPYSTLIYGYSGLRIIMYTYYKTV